MLYIDNLVIIAQKLEEFGAVFAEWKICMESKGLRVNLAKTKVDHRDVSQGQTFTSDKRPCGVCFKGVAFHSIFCNDCAND